MLKESLELANKIHKSVLSIDIILRMKNDQLILTTLNAEDDLTHYLHLKHLSEDSRTKIGNAIKLILKAEKEELVKEFKAL